LPETDFHQGRVVNLDVMSPGLREKLCRLNALEPYYFYFFLLLNLIPVLSFKFFPTVDGPAHLYNSNLIVELLKHPGSPLHDFIVFKTNINLTWFGHFILSALLFVFPAFITEKIVLLIYLIGFPVSIRHLFRTLSIDDKYLIYLIFPFTYSFLFYYGFFNFNTGLVFFVFGVSFWIKYLNNPDTRKIIVLFLLSSLICLFHLFIFAIFLLVIFLLNIQNILFLKHDNATANQNPVKHIFLQLIPLSFGLVIMVNYLLFSQTTNGPSVYLPFSKIVTLLTTIMPAKGINYGKAAVFIKWIFYVLMAFIVYFLVVKIYYTRLKKKYIFRNKIWLFAALLMLILLFVVPDSKGHAIGFLTSRLMFFFFIFLIIWLASQDVFKWFKVLVFIVVNYLNFALIIHNYLSVSRGCKLAEEIHSVSRYIEPYRVVLPVVHSDDFIYGHISNYLSTDKPIVILEDYEAGLEHFPLQWNSKNITRSLFENLQPGNNFKDWVNSINHKKLINYVFILNDEHQPDRNSYGELINNSLKSDYALLYAGADGTIKLFRRRR
jgi:hypothetical protein